MDRIAEALEIVKRAKALGDYDSNVIGMAAEVVSEELFGLRRTKSGHKDIDGYISVDGTLKSVQVKAWSSSRVRRYKGGVEIAVKTEGIADRLIVIVFYSELGEYEVIYNGPMAGVGKLDKSGRKRIILFKHLVSSSDLERVCAKCG